MCSKLNWRSRMSSSRKSAASDPRSANDNTRQGEIRKIFRSTISGKYSLLRRAIKKFCNLAIRTYFLKYSLFPYWVVFRHSRPIACAHLRCDTIRDAILTSAQKPTWVSIIYARNQQLKSGKTDMLRSRLSVTSLGIVGNPCIVSADEEKVFIFYPFSQKRHGWILSYFVDILSHLIFRT